MDKVFSNLRSLLVNTSTSSMSDSEGNSIINSLKNLNNNFNLPIYNPNYIPTRAELLHTETQNGGHMIKGLRYENKLDSTSDNLSSISSEMYGGKRSKPSPGDILHQEAIDYLKNDLKLSPLEARAYKSLAYRHIKETHTDATSIERSKLMLSLVKSENFLDQFKEKLDETIKIIENIDAIFNDDFGNNLSL
jgi:hypothetical protein